MTVIRKPSAFVNNFVGLGSVSKLPLLSALLVVFGASPLDHFLGLGRTSKLVRRSAFVMVGVTGIEPVTSSV